MKFIVKLVLFLYFILFEEIVHTKLFSEDVN